jgi:hypothetical protein
MAPMLWHSLPTEMKFALVDILDSLSLRSFAMVERETHALCVPALFKVCNLP